MTEVVRLTFVSHAMTDAMAGGRFATDEPLNATGRRQVDASIALDAPPKSFRLGENVGDRLGDDLSLSGAGAGDDMQRFVEAGDGLLLDK